MKGLLALATVALVALVLEDKTRQLAGETRQAVGEAVDQVRDARDKLKQSVRQRPFLALAVAGGCGFLAARAMPSR
jgi:ElaB/YqjD/DUF883 family membrane-anchored ribosome-binding protein